MGDPVSSAVIAEELIAPMLLDGAMAGVGADAALGAAGSGAFGGGLMTGGEVLGGGAGGFLGGESFFGPGAGGLITGYDEVGSPIYSDAVPQVSVSEGMTSGTSVAPGVETAAPYAPEAPQMPSWVNPETGALNQNTVLSGFGDAPNVPSGLTSDVSQMAGLNPQFASNMQPTSLSDMMTQAAGGSPMGGTGNMMMDASLTNGGSLPAGGPWATDAAGNFAPGSGGLGTDWKQLALKVAPDLVRAGLTQANGAPLRQLNGGIQATLDNINRNAFPFAKYQGLAEDFADPAKRMARLEGSPAYNQAKQAVMQAQARAAAKTGVTNPNSNNWAVPMANVVATNARNWENQDFDQIATMSGMKYAPGQNAASVINGLNGLYNAQQGNKMSQGAAIGNLTQTATDYLSKVLA